MANDKEEVNSMSMLNSIPRVWENIAVDAAVFLSIEKNHEVKFKLGQKEKLKVHRIIGSQRES